MAEKHAKPQQTVRQLERLLNSDIDGNKSILYGLKRVKGVGIMYANAILKVLKIPAKTKTIDLSKEQLTLLENTIQNPQKHDMPTWLFNRKKDPETGEDKHLASTKLFLTNQEDIKLMKKNKTYKGIRHMFGLPVRGQKTRSNFRRNKGKGKSAAVGVSMKGKKQGKV